MQELSILICSSDKYQCLWNLNFDFLKKYWIDCPYEVHLGTDSLIDERYKTIINRKGKYLSWSSCLLEWLNQIDSKYILLMLDDFILRKRVNNHEISYCLNFVMSNNIDCLRLVACPQPFYRSENDRLFGQYDIRMPYLVSLQASLWKKDSLFSLLKEGESIWEFEKYGSLRAKEQDFTFYGVYKTVFDYGVHIVDGGKLLRTSIYNLPIAKYNLDFPTSLLKTELIILLKRLRHFLFYRLPTPLKIKVFTILGSKLESNTVHQKTVASKQ